MTALTINQAKLYERLPVCKAYVVLTLMSITALYPILLFMISSLLLRYSFRIDVSKLNMRCLQLKGCIIAITPYKLLNEQTEVCIWLKHSDTLI